MKGNSKIYIDYVAYDICQNKGYFDISIVKKKMFSKSYYGGISLIPVSQYEKINSNNKSNLGFELFSAENTANNLMKKYDDWLFLINRNTIERCLYSMYEKNFYPTYSFPETTVWLEILKSIKFSNVILLIHKLKYTEIIVSSEKKILTIKKIAPFESTEYIEQLILEIEIVKSKLNEPLDSVLYIPSDNLSNNSKFNKYKKELKLCDISNHLKIIKNNSNSKVSSNDIKAIGAFLCSQRSDISDAKIIHNKSLVKKIVKGIKISFIILAILFNLVVWTAYFNERKVSVINKSKLHEIKKLILQKEELKKKEHIQIRTKLSLLPEFIHEKKYFYDLIQPLSLKKYRGAWINKVLMNNINAEYTIEGIAMKPDYAIVFYKDFVKNNLFYSCSLKIPKVFDTYNPKLVINHFTSSEARKFIIKCFNNKKYFVEK